jgi:hypothetical protein
MLQGQDLFATLRNQQHSVAASSDCVIKRFTKWRYASVVHVGLVHSVNPGMACKIAMSAVSSSGVHFPENGKRAIFIRWSWVCTHVILICGGVFQVHCRVSTHYFLCRGASVSGSTSSSGQEGSVLQHAA